MPFWYESVAGIIAKQGDLASIGDALGMGLTNWSIFDDLTRMRRYGNAGAHVHEDQLAGYDLEADAAAFTATVRIIVATIVLLRDRPVSVPSKL